MSVREVEVGASVEVDPPCEMENCPVVDTEGDPIYVDAIGAD